MLDDDGFRQLLDHLDRPWAGYRKVRKGVKKRVGRHMTALGCASMQAYLLRLDQDPTARDQCEERLAVTISRFFRDRRLWEHLEHRLLPELMERFGSGLSAWSAGCANGEEPYSLAMAALAAAGGARGTTALKLLATDADETCLQRAQEGRYPNSSLREVPEAFKQRWFQPAGRRTWRIDVRLGAEIRWQVHQLLAEPPQDRFHLVLLRNNLLTYYHGLRMQSAFQRIVARLEDGGLLILGTHERPPPQSAFLHRDPVCAWVYRVRWGPGGS